VNCFVSGAWPCPPPAPQAGTPATEILTSQSGLASRFRSRGFFSRLRQASKDAVTGAAQRTCWHNCGSAKSSNLTAALPGALREALEELYRPSEEALRFHAAGGAGGGGVTFIGWGQAVQG
jgi:hypothetical protein